MRSNITSLFEGGGAAKPYRRECISSIKDTPPVSFADSPLKEGAIFCAYSNNVTERLQKRQRTHLARIACGGIPATHSQRTLCAGY